jgi:hypothetical protein
MCTLSANQVDFDNLALPLPALGSNHDTSVLMHLDGTDEQISDAARALIESWEKSHAKACDGLQVSHFLTMNAFSNADYSQPPKRFWRTSWESITRKMIRKSQTSVATVEGLNKSD